MYNEAKASSTKNNPPWDSRRGLRKLDVKPRFLCGRHAFGTVRGAGFAVIRSIPYHGAWYSIRDYYTSIADPAGLDHLDTAARWGRPT